MSWFGRWRSRWRRWSTLRCLARADRKRTCAERALAEAARAAPNVLAALGAPPPLPGAGSVGRYVAAPSTGSSAVSGIPAVPVVGPPLASSPSGESAAMPGRPLWTHAGFCPTCNRPTTFVALDAWLRDHYLCVHCRSIPRERALMRVIESYFPAWRDLVIHESSPAPRGASRRLRAECRGYIPSHYLPEAAPGSIVGGVRAENLEALSFADESIDLHVTQDVLEHVFDPTAALREIARTLRPGGAHVFTVPLVRGAESSRRRARRLADGRIEHIEPPEYHGNPISSEGSLVTIDWGLDIGRRIFDACGLFTQIVRIDDPCLGIRAEYIEVFLTLKPGGSAPAGLL